MTIDEQLSRAGLRVTAVRSLVWRTISQEVEGVFSLADLEEKLPTVDRSTLFRSLTAFSEAHLLHSVDDGSGSQKYCVCRCDDHDHHHGHVHLSCTMCHRTWCLQDVSIPAVTLPEGFQVEEAEYVVKGLCPQCSQKRR